MPNDFLKISQTKTTTLDYMKIFTFKKTVRKENTKNVASVPVDFLGILCHTLIFIRIDQA